VNQLSYRAGIDTHDKSIWKRLKRNVTISAIGSGFFVAIKLVQTFLLTRFLEIDDYGRVLIVLNLFALTIAYVQLAEAAILRLAFSLLVWKRLRERRAAAVSLS
jgi:O-antigen/teichoic acid export membrane protein